MSPNSANWGRTFDRGCAVKRLVWFSKQLWREAFCFVSMIAFITSTVVFLILLVAAAMAFCFAGFFLVVFWLVLAVLTQLPPLAELALFGLMLLLSPVAYLVRGAQQGRPREGARRGAERTPLLPPNEEDQ